jgi:hypothetical protein
VPSALSVLAIVACGAFLALFAAACSSFGASGSSTNADAAAGDDAESSGVDEPSDAEAPETPDGTVCIGGLSLCSGVCRDVSRDPQNCGKCGRSCGNNAVCSNGACGCLLGTQPCGTGCCAVPDSGGCLSNLTACSGLCIDLASDAKNCGTCGHACGQNARCSQGQCGCTLGQAACNGVDCVDVNRDSANCGACGHACLPGASCSSGRCESQWTDCTPLGQVTTCDAYCQAIGRACENGCIGGVDYDGQFTQYTGGASFSFNSACNEPTTVTSLSIPYACASSVGTVATQDPGVFISCCCK